MDRNDLPDLAAFAAVVEEGGFTRAATKLGISQSALSRTIKALEARLGVRLLARTTRSVAATQAGEQLLVSLGPALRDIDAAVSRVGEAGEQPSGLLRLTMIKQAATSLVRPMLPGFLAQYPKVRVEIAIDDAFSDIVAHRFDAGIRFGAHVEKDMVAVRLGPDLRATVVASPTYLADHPPPRSPGELAGHRCIAYRLPTSGSLHAWRFARNGRPLDVPVSGPLILDDADMIAMAALDGVGLAYLFEDQVSGHLASGRLVRVLEDWCPASPGYHLYHLGRRQMPPALRVFIDTLRASRPTLSSSETAA